MTALVLYSNRGGDGATILWPDAGRPYERWTFITGVARELDDLIGYGDASITFEDGRVFPQRTPRGSTFYHIVLEQTPYPRPVPPPPEPPPVIPPVIPPVTP